MEATQRSLSNATGCIRDDNDNDDSNVAGTTPREPKPRRIGAVFEDNDNGFEAFGGLIEKSEAARPCFEEKRLQNQECMHHDMIEERKQERFERRKEEERRDRRDMERKKIGMEFSMKAIVTAVKEALKKD